MKGQLSLEFIFIMAVYILFIFILVSSLDYSKFLEKVELQEFSLKINSLRLIESERLINNHFTDMKIFIEGCSISEGDSNKSVICKKENMTKISKIPLTQAGVGLLTLYKPLS
ncbi:MAG: hypothetical protein QXT72_03280 [Candidatus Micrarchaeia archaeon]